MSNRNFVLDGEAVDAAVQALYSEVSMQISNEVYYPAYGLTDYEPDIPEEYLSSVSGFGKGTLTLAGQQYGSNQRYKGYKVQLSLNKYTSEIEYSEEDLHWLQKAPTPKRVMEFRNVIEGAANALNANINEDTAKLFYLGMGTTFFTCGDSLPLIDEVHTIRKSGVTGVPNMFYGTTYGTSTTHLAFDNAALIESLERMDRFVLNDGTQMRPCKRLRILHSIELADTVQQVLVSKYGPANATLGEQIGSAEFNRGMGRTIDHATIPDMPVAYKNYWFVVEMQRAAKMAFMAWGWKPRVNNQAEFRKGLYYNEASVLFAPIASDWRFLFGSKGDGTSTP